MTLTELEPCPFCGGLAATFKSVTNRWVITHVQSINCPIGEPITFDTEAEAITAWNTRAERTCHNTQSDLDFMCSECGKCVDNGRVIGINYCPNCGRKVVE